MVSQWLSTTWTQAGLVVLSTLGIYAAVIVAIRINGIRSFSKVSSFDFATTVAVGSLIATIAANSSSLLNGVIALAVILGAQKVIARSRFRPAVSSAVDNEPVLLMAHGEFVEEGLAQTNITPKDVVSKLREHGVNRFEHVAAVVVETTGDISVLHGADAAPEIDVRLYHDVRFAERLDVPAAS